MKWSELPEVYRNLDLGDSVRVDKSDELSQKFEWAKTTQGPEFWAQCYGARKFSELAPIKPEWVKKGYFVSPEDYAYITLRVQALTVNGKTTYHPVADGCVKESQTDWARNVRRGVGDILEDIQIAQVTVGGRFMRRGEIASMTVQQLLELLVPNGVQFDITVPEQSAQDKELEDLLRRGSSVLRWSNDIR